MKEKKKSASGGAARELGRDTVSSANVRRFSGQGSEDESGGPERAQRGRRRGLRRRPGREADAAGPSAAPPRAGREAGPAPSRPARPSPAPPPARPPARGPAYSSARPGRCSVPVPLPGAARQVRAGPGTADGSRRSGASAPRVAPAPRPPTPRPPGPASAAVGWMRSGCPVRSQAGAAAEAGRAPPSQRRGPG